MEPQNIHKLKIQQLNNNNNNSRIIKQKNLRKMSTMPEEEGSEDIETDNQRMQDLIDSDDDESQSDEELDHENNKLLDNNNKKIIQISNIETTTTTSSTSSSSSSSSTTKKTNNKKTSTKNLSNESIIINDKINSTNKCQNNNLINDTTNNKIYRDNNNSINGCSKVNKYIEHYSGRQQYKYPSMRSLKLNVTSNGDDHLIHQNNYQQQHHLHHQHQQYYPHSHQYNNSNHQPASSWSSISSPIDIGLTNNSIRTTPYYDTVSIRSLASIGMGSSDGRKLTIRRVPTSPSELLNMVHPPTPIEDDLSTSDSFDDGHGDDTNDYRSLKRPHWANKMQFVLACVGYSVGLGNVWRFPYLCYKSGGGVFLVPYFIILIVCGIPLLYMELALGQFTRRGPIGALGQICPLLKGAGLSSVVISFLMSTYHNVIIAYAIYYFFAAFRADHPWAGCNNSWNTESCWTGSSNDNKTRPDTSRTPSEEFFDNKVLQISTGIEVPGNIRWEIFACLLSAWIIVYFSTWKSIKSSSQVRYLTATLPLILIIVFLARSLTLEGAEKGLQFFFRPRWHLLADHKVWVNAAAQIFSSVGISFGSMICFASYNKFHNNIFIDTMAVSFINAFSCLLVGIFAFATIGNIAMEQNMSVEAVLSDGPGLVFVVYPQAMAKMPASQLWAVLFFFMLLCLSLNSQFAIIEVVVTSIQDGFPNWVKTNLLCHEILVFIICIVSFVFGLPNVTQGGIYFFQLIDHYAASISIMFLAFFEVIAISWFYGVKRLGKNVKEMTGRAPSLYFRYCWLIAAPLLIMSVWVFSLIDYEPPTYGNGAYKYPWWAETIGWGIASLSLMCIPAFAIYVLIRSDGKTFIEKLRNSIKPHFEACIACGQEYCAEQHSIHSLEDHELKEPLHDINNFPINTIPINYIPVKS